MKNIILFLFVITFNLTFCQNAQDIIDGLKKELKTNPDEKRTATIYSDIGYYYAIISLDSAIVYSNKAISLLDKINDPAITSQIYSDVAAVYFRKEDFNKSKMYYLKSYDIRKKSNDINGQNKVNINLASIYMETNEYNNAIKKYIETLNYFEKNNDFAKVNIIKSNIGELFTKLKNYPKAIQYLKEAELYNKKNKLIDRLCETYLNLGNAYKLAGDTLKTIESYSLSKKYCLLSGNSKASSIAIQGLSLMNSYLNNKEEAKKLLDQSSMLKKQVGSEIDQSNLKISEINVLIREKKYSLAYQNLKKIEKFFYNKNSKEDLIYVYKSLIPLFSKLKISDSTEIYLDTYIKLNGELTQQSISKSVFELETKYQTAKKEQEIAKKNNQIIITSLVALSFLLIGFLIYRNQKTKNHQQKQESILKEALLKIEAENQLQEQRLGISKELHDNIGSQLTFVISAIDTLKQSYPNTNEKIDNQLENINAFTKNTITELRDTVWVMNTKEINSNELKLRLFENIERAKMSHQNIDFKVNIDNFEIENSNVALNLFRTIQEALNNALKYANATEIEIVVQEKNDQIMTLVSDNGLGFDIETIKKGNGLKNMKKRIQTINGTFNIESQENLGTKISVVIPKNV